MGNVSTWKFFSFLRELLGDVDVITDLLASLSNCSSSPLFEYSTFLGEITT